MESIVIGVNTVKKLLRREIGGFPRMACSTATEKFRNIQLQEEYDTYDPNIHWFQFPRERSEIRQIVAAKGVIFARAQCGLCAAFNRTTNERIGYLNISPDDEINCVFYDEHNDSLITRSMDAQSRYIYCVTTPIEYIRSNQLDAGSPLLESAIRFPGFVAFDVVNGKILTYSEEDDTYTVFDSKNYSFLYSISKKDIREIRISLGIILLVYERTPSHVPLTILSIEDGKILKSFNHLLHRNKRVEFIDQISEKVLVKQENEKLQILDVRNSELIEVSGTELMRYFTSRFLYKRHLFLTFTPRRTVVVWNFRGEIVTSFEDLQHGQAYFLHPSNVYVTSDQDLIISYCKAEDDGDVPPVGSINMNNILTGKCIAKICPLDPALRIAPRKRENSGRSTITSTIREALEDVTALFYDEDSNEIYTGNKQGLIHVWSN